MSHLEIIGYSVAFLFVLGLMLDYSVKTLVEAINDLRESQERDHRDIIEAIRDAKD